MSRFACIALLAACGNAAPDAAQVDASAIDARAIDARPIDAPLDAHLVVDDPCLPGPGAGHRAYTCNGITFDVDVPAPCVAGGCGVILDVHGLTMSGPMEDANDGMRARGGAAGFVVIQPSANPAPPQASWGASDEPKVYDFLTRAIAVYAIDPDRVHMTGFSQGGFMTWRFLCSHAELFASVAPAAAASNCAVIGNPAGPPACSFTGAEVPSRKLPILYMHGRADHNYIPFSCAQPQVDAIVSAWGLTSNGVVASSPTFTRTRWSDGAGTVVEFLAHDYSSSAQVPFVSASELQGHCFPGSTDPGTQPGQLFPFRCDQPASFVWGAEVVSFFVAHPRGGGSSTIHPPP
jgi:polyhydroxybutyrate depolymerase